MANWLDHWIEDIDQLTRELPRLHINLFHNCTEQAFQEQAEQLKADLPTCDNAMVVVRLMALVASIGDAHTALIPPAGHFLPYEFYWFNDDIHIVATRHNGQNDLGSQLIAIDGLPISEVIKRLTGIIAHENHSFVTSHLPRYLAMVDLLYGLDICESTDSVQITLQPMGGTIESKTVLTVHHHDLTSGLIRLENCLSPTTRILSSQTHVPLYCQKRDRSFWFEEIIPDTIYIQYNACRAFPDDTLPDVFADLMYQIDLKQPQKLVFDLRNNHGGDSTLLEPLIEEIRDRMQAMRHPVQAFVIIGRDTFSSALLNAYALKNRIGAIVVGEPSGGKPNCYGEVQYLVLKNAHLRVRYSTQYYHLIDDDSLPSMIPDRICMITFADFMAGKDPCLDACLR